MVKDFYTDLAFGKIAEKIVYDTFSALTTEYEFINVSNDRDCWHKGDIKAIHKETGISCFIEVKNDSRIADTHNVLCEEMIWYEDIGDWFNGNMHSQYDYYCVVSEEERKIYVINFPILQSIYKEKGRYDIIPHKGQTTYCYLVPLSAIENAGGLIKTVEY